MENNKLSFKEIVNRFENKFGVDWCNNKQTSEQVADLFIDYIKSLPSEQFDYEKVDNLL